MTPSEWDDLLDLWADDALPETLASRVEGRQRADTNFAREAALLRRTVARLKNAPAARPDPWLAERVLGRLLREHDAAQSPAPAPDFSPVLDILTP